MSVLVVDAVEDWQVLVSRLLKQYFDRESQMVTTIDEAKDLLAHTAFDLLILAKPVTLSNIDELVRLARALSPNIKVIFHVNDFWDERSVAHTTVQKGSFEELLKTVEMKTQWPMLRSRIQRRP